MNHQLINSFTSRLKHTTGLCTSNFILSSHIVLSFQAKHIRASQPGPIPSTLSFTTASRRPLRFPYLRTLTQTTAIPPVATFSCLRPHFRPRRSVYICNYNIFFHHYSSFHPTKSRRPSPISQSGPASRVSTMDNNVTLPQPPGSVSTQTLSNYQFPTHRLKQRQLNPERTPLVLVACGSFSPITYLHLRMFEMCADFAKFNTEFEVMGGYLSPVSDAYKKAGLASSQHR